MSSDNKQWFHRFAVIAIGFGCLGVGCSGGVGAPASGANGSEDDEASDGDSSGSNGDGSSTDGDGDGSSNDGTSSTDPSEGSSNDGTSGSSSGSGDDDGPGDTGGSAGGSSAGGSADVDGDGSQGSAPDEPVECLDDVVQLGTAPMRRLSSREYLNTLEDLFPSTAPELPILPIEDPVDSFDNDARALGASDVHVSRWEEIAFRFTRDVTSSGSALEQLLPCAQEVEDRDSALTCGDDLIDDFGLKTHRRPLSSDERERYRELFETQLDEIDFEAAAQLTMMAMLQSPWFLYRLEVPETDAAQAAVPLDSWQMASRLSYFLWQRMPDDELFVAAEGDELMDADGIETQVRRMLTDPRAQDAVADFHRQWLFFDRILREEHDSRLPELFPDWDERTQLAAHEELSRFVKRSVFEGDGTLSDLLLSTEAEINADLAEIYGVDAPDEEWGVTSLPADERAGLLTRVGFLAAHAHSANGSPPLRGVYVMRRLFCLPPASPPPDADTSPPTSLDEAETNRQVFEERTAPPECQGCHIVIDGFGFGFEHYDAIGAYRETDNGHPVDAKVTLVGTDVTGEVDGALEMSRALAESEQVAACAVSRWYRYSQGRSLESVDDCQLERLNESFAASGGNIIELMVELTTSAEFRHRPATSN